MAVTATQNAICSFLLSILLLFAFTLARDDDDDFGFTVDLIHRHSPNSPYYNPSETPFHSLKNALRRSANRVNHFKRTLVSPHLGQSVLISGYGDYLMRLSIGTPRFDFLASVDTCSDLVWTQCRPCFGCFKQRDALFDPRYSSTYRNLTCDSRQCKCLKDHRFCESHVCHYSYSYRNRDECTIEGVLAKDTVSLATSSGDFVSFSKTNIGCTTYENGDFDNVGVVGLGRGKLSFISKMNVSIHGRFSYCLVPYFSMSSSRMSFGSRSVHSDSEVATTELVSRNDSDTYYFLTLEGISVEDDRIECRKCLSRRKGNIIIDTGTTITFLPEELYHRLESRVRDSIDFAPVYDPAEQLNLCYRETTHFRTPLITMHFTNVSVELDSMNAFIRVRAGVVCFAFAPTDDIAVYGNWQQMNFLIGYDLRRKRVSFRRTDCTHY